MFGRNQITGQKAFANATPKTLKVTSIFYTLQGEGPFAGRPAVFVRLTGCNLACSFCDTFFDAGDEMSFDSILETAVNALREARPASNRGKVGLVITGGEPFLQRNLLDFVALAVNYFLWVQIETNGTISPRGISSFCTIVCSPKCAERDGVPTHYLKPSDEMLERADCLKFVMRASNRLSDPYAEVPEWARESSRTIYVSPMNVYNDLPAKAKAMRWVGNEAGAIPDLHMRSTVDEVVSFWEPGLLDMKANQLNHEYVGQYCLKHGLRMNLQMHLYAGLA
jgi:organic radical activating enzyme